MPFSRSDEVKARRPAALSLLASAAIALAATAPAWGDEDWKEYSFPDQRFAIQFPSPPKVTTDVYAAATADGRTVTVPASVYELKRGGTIYKVTVADLAHSPADDPKALEHALAFIRARETVALDTAVSMGNSSCGRYLGVQQPDGALNYIALFYDAKARRFYDVRAQVPASEEAEHGADAVHFQQSLSFLPDSAVQASKVVYPDNWRAYDFQSYGFSIRFPAPPTVEQGAYTTAAGITTAATRIWARDGDTLYRVTAAPFWRTAADQPDALEQAVAVWERQGRTLSDQSASVMNGQCGRDLVVQTAKGEVASAKIFIPSYQHRLLIVEVRKTGAAADLTAGGPLYFRSSFTVAEPPDD